MSERDILGSYWTTAGSATPAGAPGPIVGSEWSPFSWQERCAHAARVGLRGLGIWHSDLSHLLERHQLVELRQIFDDAGLEYLELEFLMDWYLPDDDERRKAADAIRRQLFEAAALLGAHHIKVGNIFGVPVVHERLVESFGALCADAASQHEAPIAYELMPFDVNADSLQKAISIVVGAGASNGGLALDTWHLGKLGVEPVELRTIPAQYVTYAELSDGMRENRADLMEETTSHRRLPGEGEFDLAGYIDVLLDLGYRGPWGVEVLSADLRALSIGEAFDCIPRTTNALLARPSRHV